MKTQLKSLTLILIGIIGLQYTANSQSIYTVKESKNSDVKLEGTSSMHDWGMEARTSTGEAQFVFKSGSAIDLVSIKSLSFAILVVDLKSDSDGFNKNAYEALKSNKYKDICYTLTTSTVSAEKGGYLIKSVGNLVITGVTKEIKMDVHGIINADGTITCNGSYKLNMTDYKVKPPSFMWGAVKTGENVTLDFNVVYGSGKGV